ncbi:MAG TPA: response regulator transcription factor [Steroidobacteraceae bacterium]|nr:response regulator transcription factor [Steroidobacteraceae bacterium]
MALRENTAPHLLVVDDDEVVTRTLKLYLESAGFAVSTASDGVRALELARGADVALVILDIMIPGLSGQDVCRQLREGSSVPVLMLTARTLESERIAGLEMGADDYVAKPFSPREIVARVRALLRRADVTPGASGSRALRIGAMEVDRWSRQTRVAGSLVSLTPTEFRILDALVRNPGRVFTREALLAHAFGPDYEGVDRTLDTHVTNLRRKLAAHSAERFILTVHGVGYRLASPDELQN